MDVHPVSFTSSGQFPLTEGYKNKLRNVAKKIDELKIFVQNPQLSKDELSNGFLERVKSITLSDQELYAQLFSVCKEGASNINWQFLLHHISDDFFKIDDNFKFLLAKLLEFKDFNNAVLISRLDRIESSSVKDNLNLDLLKTNSDDFWVFWFQKLTNVTLFHNYDLLPEAVKSERVKYIVDLNTSFIDEFLKYKIESTTDSDTTCCWLF